MRILFDLRLLKNPQTGLARYTFAIISAFIKKFSSKNIEILLLVNLPLPKEFEFLCELEKQNKVIFVEQQIQPFSILQRFSLSTLINKVNLNIILYHFDPPIGLNCKIIFVVHDLLPLIVKNYISSFSLLKKLYFLYSIKYSIKNCYRCIAVSNTTKGILSNTPKLDIKVESFLHLKVVFLISHLIHLKQIFLFKLLIFYMLEIEDLIKIYQSLRNIQNFKIEA